MLASANRGKIAEFQAMLGDQVDFLTLASLGLESPEETGSTFEENAELKARFVYNEVGIATLADDSGLEVDALNGMPGVRSARYAGEHCSDADNRALLLRKLINVPEGLRSARFVAVIAIVDSSGRLTRTRGTCEGKIAFSERGCGGFGYDSIFELPSGQTMAEIDASDKNFLSHRSQAIRLALPTLRHVLGLTDVGMEESATTS